MKIFTKPEWIAMNLTHGFLLDFSDHKKDFLRSKKKRVPEISVFSERILLNLGCRFLLILTQTRDYQ